MRISRRALAEFVALEGVSARALRELLDDLGVEVKRMAQDDRDTYFDLELLANRGDHRCYEGIAREIHARTDRALLAPDVSPLPASDQVRPRIRIETELCFRYDALECAVITPSAGLGEGARHLLATAGVDAIHPVVDVTNVVLLELGQPTNAFDADRIEGELIVRVTAAGERCTPLNASEPVTLPAGTLVIADAAKILAIAGVICCRGSEIGTGTKRVLIESACFDPVSIRRTSKAMKISTLAAQRFERGGDPRLTRRALERIARLFEEYRIAKPAAAAAVHGGRTFERSLAFSLESATRFLGWPMTERDVRAFLQRLGYRLQGDASAFSAEVPSWRYWDVDEQQDIFEDLARAASYEACPEAQPQAAVGSQQSPREQDLTALRQHLVSQGFFEVFSDAFYGPQERDALAGDASDPLFDHIQLENSITGRYSMLRNNCLVSALQAVASNLRFGERDMRFFEACRTYHRAPAGGGAPIERELLWGVVSGSVVSGWRSKPRPLDYWDLKGLLEAAGESLRRPIETQYSSAEGHALPHFHPTRSARLRCGNTLLGGCGELDAELVARFQIKGVRVLYFEIELEPLLAIPRLPWMPELPPSRPPSQRTISFVLPRKVEAAEVAAAIRRIGADWLQALRVVDSFDIEDGRSVTFELEIGNERSDRTSAEIADMLRMLSVEIPKQLASSGVKFRS